MGDREAAAEALRQKLEEEIRTLKDQWRNRWLQICRLVVCLSKLLYAQGIHPDMKCHCLYGASVESMASGSSRYTFREHVLSVVVCAESGEVVIAGCEGHLEETRQSSSKRFPFRPVWRWSSASLQA